MDKKAINKFAVEARRELITDISLRLRNLGITESGIAAKEERSTSQIEFYGPDVPPVIGEDIKRRQALVNRLTAMAKDKSLKDAIKDLTEEVAYTWFNRIIAIRFMEVNGYLPSGVRVLSSETHRNEPDILRDAFDAEDALGGYTPDERNLIRKAQETELPKDMDSAYAMLFTKQANALHKNLPELFEKTDDFMQLLFTPNYNQSVIKNLVTMISEEDFDVSKEGQVEIIGWLYQYYNSEPHDQVVNINGGPVKTSDIPAATQLFTTDWVVRYMIDNSLGKLYLEHYPNSPIKDDLKYLLPGPIERTDKPLDLADLKVLDDAMGSGHILVYAFDLLIKMYDEQGYSNREAAAMILAHNLYGLEIDKRAYQLAYFALMMKARQYNRRILRKPIQHHLNVFENMQEIPEDVFAELKGNSETIADIRDLIQTFKEGKLLGSIMHFEKNYDLVAIRQAIDTLPENTGLDVFGIHQAKKALGQMVSIASVLQTKFDVVATNPPYLNRMNGDLKKFVKKYYKPYSGDLFSVFIWKNINMTKQNGYAAFMTPFVWMFIKTYESLRRNILENQQISSLIQMEYSAFEEATVPINTFVVRNSQSHNFTGTYLKLSDFKGGMEIQRQYVKKAIEDPSVSYVYRTNQTNFEKIPGSPVAYWVPENVFEKFQNSPSISDFLFAGVGIQTGNNLRFLRRWYEVSFQNIKFNACDAIDFARASKKWAPISKGGPYRKWFGNLEYVINWENNGNEIKQHLGASKQKAIVPNEQFYFHSGFTWSDITSGKFSMRLLLPGMLFESNALSAFSKQKNISDRYLMGFANSTVGNYLLSILNPTIHMKSGYFLNLPVSRSAQEPNITEKVRQNIVLCHVDWNLDERSWGFKWDLLVSCIAEHNRNWTVEAAFNQWKREAEDRFNQLKSNEEELNRIFIDLYGLQDELSPEEDDKEVSVRKADLTRDIKAFISYFIGCVFGRYSIDTPGLAFAGGSWDSTKYETFKPSADDFILLTDEDYFGDSRDIINRFKEFLTTTFGEEHLAENMKFIANALGKRGSTPEEQIRSYIRDDFYKKDHLSTYQKRPIYWELNSGRNGGFVGLMYLHRYNTGTMAMIRTKYLHPLQEAYKQRLEQLQNFAEKEKETRQKNAYKKQISKLTKQMTELVKYDEQLQHVANLNIDLDLDDGVLVNHEKLQAGTKILTPIK
ncbi:BREX-1 system adenine-specific DNA-methyltransferase PglX [Lacticaseibacillus casei]|uniref:site-specific DNA-methyltransferase (adenine-specific) n=2 Tax=Lacticaseibacillus TaxID=2759736 RepID=A0AAD1ETI1_LACCA|nr:BREX-1 system adenine-specific DNA-methyltransferase PglX [Lacticaseibacillus casei]QPC17189.1 BREX-1 system adenine-specific DNA-methyltransferase PglX [Lacticaseibacillus casei]TLF35933.1 BREX-1 system adenine-specific DNA-methyltransferase PglX [Lacticaseibacillus casei]TLF37335.1 BREX-1 system adenine-specific DNA-methyltransferase PglX [Lacticaseibacillus casei]BAN75035.1 putative restriction enzyme [Lacticaseibacillus casei DSM 20011 = JCM 1134 = ATCC 393]